MIHMGRSKLGSRVRQRVGALVVDNAFRGLARAGALLPAARPERHRVEVTRDLCYGSAHRRRPEHHLDVYRPLASRPPHPVVLYVHGGGFRILSKETHWIMALAFARRGYLVFNISYRLAPRHPYPAPLEDAAAAFEWVVGRAGAFGGDLSRLVLAGESAGANLVTALAVASCYERPEPFARRVFDTGVVPRAVVAQCGLHQVSDTHRFVRRKPRFPRFLWDRLEEVERAYLGAARRDLPGGLALADPLCVLEGADGPARPLPAFVASVGTRDPLLDDTRRLAAAVRRHGAPCLERYYEGELHAFQAMVFRKNARRCWLSTYSFLDEQLAPAGSAAVA